MRAVPEGRVLNLANRSATPREQDWQIKLSNETQNFQAQSAQKILKVEFDPALWIENPEGGVLNLANRSAAPREQDWHLNGTKEKISLGSNFSISNRKI